MTFALRFAGRKIAILGPLSGLGLLVAIFGFLSDRLSKWWLLDVYDISRRVKVEITGFFDLVMAWNPGVSYGLFPAESLWGRLILVTFSLVVVGGLGAWLARVNRPLMALAIGLIIGGALGNIYDRIKFGAVADFFSFHVAGYYWYIFNVADIWIVLGVGLLLWDAIYPLKEEAVKPTVQSRSE